MARSPAVAASAKRPIAFGMNEVLFAVVLVIAVLKFGLFPLLFRPTLGSEILLVAAVGLSSPLHWGLVHESFHGNFSGNATTNRRIGRCLASLLAMSWDMLRFGHLMHHDSNRHTLDRPEVLPPGGSWLKGAVGYFVKLLGGHAVVSALASLGVLLPLPATRWIIKRVGQDSELAKIQSAALKTFTNSDRRSRIRTDLAVDAVLIAAALWCWGRDWPVFVGCFAARYFMLSVLDNSHHYGTLLDSGVKARNTWLPQWAAILVLNGNLHGVHHRTPDLNWRQLRGDFEETGSRYDCTWLGCVIRQFKGPVREHQLKPATSEG